MSHEQRLAEAMGQRMAFAMLADAFNETNRLRALIMVWYDMLGTEKQNGSNANRLVRMAMLQAVCPLGAITEEDIAWARRVLS